MDNKKLKRYKKMADNELTNPSQEDTGCFLKTNKIATKNGQFTYDRYEIANGWINFYYKIEDEPYFFCVQVNLEDYSISVSPVSYNHCFFSAVSNDSTLKEMAALTNLKHTSGWSKGDLRRDGRTTHTFSCIDFELLKHDSYFFADEPIELILMELEKDIEGILALGRVADTRIVVWHRRYITSNGGMSMSRELVKRLADLNLRVDIDGMGVWGTLPEEDC